MPETSPSALGWALTSVRTALGWTKARLARLAGFAETLLGPYERGEKLTRETADFLVGLLGHPPEAVDVLLFAHRLIFFPEAAEEAASPVTLTPEERQRINRATLAAGWAAAEAVLAELIRRKKKEKADAALAAARKPWERLKAASMEDRRDRIIELPELRRWPLAVLACEASVRAAAHDARKSLELANLALFIAERVQEPESWRRRLEGYCWAHIANSLRVANKHAEADQAFAHGWELRQAGADSDPDLLPEWQPLAMEGALRGDERRFAEALVLLDRARDASGAEPVANARILLSREYVCDQMGDVQGALAALEDAAPFVEGSRDPQLLLSLRFKAAKHLCHLKRHEEAEATLSRVRELAVEQGDELNLSRVLWLQSRVSAAQGRIEEAIAGIEQVRGDFLGRELPYDAALASLDLAVLWLTVQRTGEVRDLAVAMEGIFKAKGIAREALAALRLFCEAAMQEAATLELAQSVITRIEQVRRSTSHG